MNMEELRQIVNLRVFIIDQVEYNEGFSLGFSSEDEDEGIDLGCIQKVECIRIVLMVRCERGDFEMIFRFFSFVDQVDGDFNN